MVKRFQKYIAENNLFKREEEILLAISGGIDSAVMLDLFSKSGFNIAISHCNFKLRMFESDDDEMFVRQLAHKYNVDIFVNWCNTKEYAQDKKMSIQEAARELRYTWFNQVCAHNDYTKIAVAHHQDDRIETFFINLARGAGLKGLKSIPVSRDNIIRPLMFATRDEIEEYAKEHLLEYREDSSNNKDYYQRNNIRHNLIPKLEEIKKGFKNSIKKSIDNLVDSDKLLQQVVTEKTNKLIITDPNGSSKISITDLLKLSPFNIWVFYLLSEYGFPRSITDSICNALKEGNSTGLRFNSPEYELLIDRELILIRKIIKKDLSTAFKIPDNKHYITSPIKINFEKSVYSPEFSFLNNENIAYFDYDKLSFPLVLRKWKSGDRFTPFGMKGSKLVSDILIDKKVDSFAKDNVYVIMSGDDIIWLVGYRSSHKYRVQKTTSTVMMMELISNQSGFDLSLFKTSDI